MNSFKLLLLLFFGFLAVHLYAITGLACTCSEYDTPVCVQYGRADAVFIGTVKKTVSRETANQPLASTMVDFEVEKSLKGVNESNLRIGYIFGTSCSWVEEFKQGDRWLVYGYKNSAGDLTIPFCTGSRKIDSKDDELSLLDTILKGRMKEIILGKLLINTSDDLPEKGEITVSGYGKTYKTNTDKDGNYKVEVDGAGTYKVKIIVPFNAAIFPNSEFYPNLTHHTNTAVRSSAEYQTVIQKGACGYSQINVSKYDPRETATISGRLIERSGRPVSNAVVKLVKMESSEKETLDSEVSSDWIFPDSRGKFHFSFLREGRYLIVVNPENFPENNQPYLRTYFPGVRNYSSAQVITIRRGQNLSGLSFKLPRTLPQQEVKVALSYIDGSPVELSLDYGRLVVRNKYQFFISLYNLKGDSVGSDQIFKLNNGLIAFPAFENYTYILMVETFDANEKRVFGFARFKVTKNQATLKVILNREGKRDELLQKEIQEALKEK